RSELRHPTDMVAVIMRNQNVVNLSDAGVFRRGDDAVRIPPAESVPASVNQQGLSLRRNEQRGLAPLHIYAINLQRLFIGCRNGAQTLRKNERDDQYLNYASKIFHSFLQELFVAARRRSAAFSAVMSRWGEASIS